MLLAQLLPGALAVDHGQLADSRGVPLVGEDAGEHLGRGELGVGGSGRRSLTRPRTLSTGRRFPAVLPEELVAEVAGRLGAAALGFACVSKATARVLTSHEHVWRDAYIGAFGEDELADELPPSMWHACLKHAQRA